MNRLASYTNKMLKDPKTKLHRIICANCKFWSDGVCVERELVTLFDDTCNNYKPKSAKNKVKRVRYAG